MISMEQTRRMLDIEDDGSETAFLFHLFFQYDERLDFIGRDRMDA